MSLQQHTELCDGGRTSVLQEVHPCLLKSSGMDVHVPSPQKKKRKTTTVPTNLIKLRTSPTVQPDSVSDQDVKCRTGFRSVTMLLYYVAIVCNGSIDDITHTTTNLSWFEEWFTYFEIVWGKSLNRVVDAEVKYGLNVRGVLAVFNNKLSKVVSAVKSWPRFAFHEEDNQLRSPKWRERYANKRVIM
jgi:hypothetical protein